MKAMLVGVGLLSLALVAGFSARAVANCGSCDKDKAKSDSKVPDLTTEQLKKAIADGAVVFDARGADDYKAGHIPGAKNLPVKDVSAEALGSNKDAVLVFYCGSTQCPLSKKAAAKAVELGYKNVRTYEKGIKGWQEDGEKAEAGS